MRIGFACRWDPDAPSTWSGTPWHLRAAMRRLAEIPDVGVVVSRPTRLFLTASHLRWQQGRLTTLWEQSRAGDVHSRVQIQRAASRLGCDAVLEIQDLAPLDLPFFIYQDMTFDALIALIEAGEPIFRDLSLDELRRRRDRQHQVYERAAGIFSMSHWLAGSLIKDSGVPADRVHVLHPGLHLPADGTEEPTAGQPPAQPAPSSAQSAQSARPAPRRRLLFIGRHFHSKGGDLAVAALGILRREVDPAITLTMVGPRHWPLPGAIPDGVDFRGALPRNEVAALYPVHDLFVLPTRIEGFGLVFAEALANGLPCVGRDAFAMPEIITPELNGALLSRDDPAELARLIAGVLANDELYEKCRLRAGEVTSWFSWDRAARQAIDTIAATLG